MDRRYFNPIENSDMSYESGINHAKYMNELEVMLENSQKI